jgi:hypothetical protein
VPWFGRLFLSNVAVLERSIPLSLIRRMFLECNWDFGPLLLVRRMFLPIFCLVDLIAV